MQPAPRGARDGQAWFRQGYSRAMGGRDEIIGRNNIVHTRRSHISLRCLHANERKGDFFSPEEDQFILGTTE
jgi:hypothetical protein